MDTQEELLLAFLLERIRDEVLVIPWLLPVTVPVGSPFLYVEIRNRKEIHCVLNKFLILLWPTSQYDKHTLHCVLGSMSSNSDNSMFPTS